jgi:hypothetical protein
MRPIALITLCLVTVCLRPVKAASERVTIDGLISADPFPAGFSVTQRDVKQGDRVVANNLLFTKTDSPTRAMILIERREIADRAARAAKIKAYLTAAAAPWLKQGWVVQVRSLPNLDTVDFSQPIVIDLDATKDGHKPIAIDLQIIFEKFAYEMESLSSDAAELKTMIAWCASVRPLEQPPATQPAK